MLLEQHGCGIHALCFGTDGAGGAGDGAADSSRIKSVTPAVEDLIGRRPGPENARGETSAICREGGRTRDPYYRRHCPTRHRHSAARQAEPNRRSGYAHSMANATVRENLR